MNFDFFKVRIAIISLVLFALLVSSLFLNELLIHSPEAAGHNGISRYEKRFEGLKKVLPQGSIIGYISGREPINSNPVIISSYDDWLRAKRGAEYILTQYALSPIVVDSSADRQVVVANFNSPVIDFQIFAERDLILVKDFGNGVMLFKKKRAR